MCGWHVQPVSVRGEGWRREWRSAASLCSATAPALYVLFVWPIDHHRCLYLSCSIHVSMVGRFPARIRRRAPFICTAPDFREASLIGRASLRDTPNGDQHAPLYQHRPTPAQLPLKITNVSVSTASVLTSSTPAVRPSILYSLIHLKTCATDSKPSEPI